MSAGRTVHRALGGQARRHDPRRRDGHGHEHFGDEPIGPRRRLAELARPLAQRPDGRAGLFRDDAWPHVVLADGRLSGKHKQGNVKCRAWEPIRVKID